MIKKDISIMPLQPFIVFNTNKYERIVAPQYGISHYYEFEMDSRHHAVIDAVPDASIDLLFNIGNNKVETYLSGTVFHVKKWNMGMPGKCFGVRFQPGQGILPREISMDMIVNDDIQINSNIFGDNLDEKIAEAATFSERKEIFCHAYMEFLKKNQTEDMKKNVEEYLRARFYETKGIISMKELAEETGYSECYLRRIFKQYHGISPKQFAQFIRFQYLLGIAKINKNHNEEIALCCGYYDEAHMMKEFKKYMGITMEKYKEMLTNTKEFM